MMHVRRQFLVSCLSLIALGLAATACKNRGATLDMESLSSGPQSRISRDSEGFVVQQFDATGDGTVDVVRYFEELPDPNNPAITRRRMRKMEIDVNGDGMVNVRRFYDDHGSIVREEIDKTFDGHIDTVNYYEGDHISRKEQLSPGENRVAATRYYRRGVLERVEIDTLGDSRTDYWEYYEEGVLTRVGRDENGDGRADSWKKR